MSKGAVPGTNIEIRLYGRIFCAFLLIVSGTKVRYMMASDRERLIKRLRLYRERLVGLTMQPGGHGITISDDCHIPVDLLRSRGTTLSVAADDFKAYLQQELIDTAEAARTMGCTRQNIQDLVRRGRMRPVITLRNNFLFLRSEL